MKQNRIAAFGLAAGLLGGGLVGAVFGVPGLAGAQEAETTTTTAPAAPVDKGRWVDDALAPLVQNGTLNQAQADAVADALEAARPARGHRGGHRGTGGFRGAKLDAAATALDMTAEELRTALQGGQSLADVATAKGIAPKAVVDALVTDAKAKLAEAVAAGRITQAQADEKGADLTSRLEALVNGDAPFGGPGGRGGHRHPEAPPA